MDKYGYGLMLDCAKFWTNRLEPGEDGKLHINDVVGPNEYKKYVDDSAFTNYLVWWTLTKAIRPTQHLLCLLRRAVVVRGTGLWQAAELGGRLRISPNLPRAWKNLSYTLLWKGQKLAVTVTPGAVEIVNQTNKEPVALEVWGEDHGFEKELIVPKR